ncbi:transposable element Tcb1 transposase [Trichonephila clavipes]|nr:transposable element Tcb1 transposase [Trichonephila clavipes]
MSEDQVNAIKTPAACMKTVSEDRVQLCGHNKNISFLNEDGVSRQGKVMRQHPKQKWFPRQAFRCNNRIVMAQRMHLDDFLRGRNIGRLECGCTQLEVSEELGIAQNVISRLWQRFQDDGNVSRGYSTGHPHVTTPNEDRYLAVTAKRNRRSTASDMSRQLSSATSTTVSRQTVYRCLGHIGLYQ